MDKLNQMKLLKPDLGVFYGIQQWNGSSWFYSSLAPHRAVVPVS